MASEWYDSAQSSSALWHERWGILDIGYSLETCGAREENADGACDQVGGEPFPENAVQVAECRVLLLTDSDDVRVPAVCTDRIHLVILSRRRRPHV